MRHESAEDNCGHCAAGNAQRQHGNEGAADDRVIGTFRRSNAFNDAGTVL